MAEDEPPPARSDAGDKAGDNAGGNAVDPNSTGGNPVDPNNAAAQIAAGVNNIDLGDPADQVVRCQHCPQIFRGADALLSVLGHAHIFHGAIGGAAAPPLAPQRGGGGGSGPKRPNLAAPHIGDQCSPAAWEDFIRKWHAYTRTSNITADIASAYFLHCLDDGVQRTLYRQAVDPNETPIAELIASARAV